MKHYIIIRHGLWLLFVAIPMLVFSTGELQSTGARSAAMGRCSVALSDTWSIMNNQAGLAKINRFSAGIAYESPFMLNELSAKSIGLVAPTKYGVLGLSYQNRGYELYNEQKLGLAYAKGFGPFLRIGLQLDYLQTSLGDGYGQKGSVTFELGLQSDISDKITIAVWTFNPLRVKLADFDDEKIQSIYRFGIQWKASESFIALVDVEKNSNTRPVIARLGLEYQVKDRFFIRTGTSTGLEIFSLGAGFRYKYFQFDLGAAMHETLGFSPQASIQIGF